MLDATMHSVVDLKKSEENFPRCQGDRIRKTLQGACKEEARIQDAIGAIREGKNIQSAAIEFGIAYSTLQDILPFPAHTVTGQLTSFMNACFSK